MPDDTENTGETAKAPEAAQSSGGSNGELPAAESPPLSPAGGEEAKPEPEVVPDSALIIVPPAREQTHSARFRLRPRHKRHAILAASVAVAAGVGVIVGALAVGGPREPRPDTASLQRQAAMQQSIDGLTRQVASFKASLESGTKSARSEIAKISERLNRAPETTGSIPASTTPVPTPPPRPPVRTAAAEPRVLPDWSIRDVRGGFVYVQGHGDIYEVAPGAPLPGLGVVSDIKRRDGRWVVITPKGLIISQRDRRYFEPY
jgi:hypothetical protein